jgi:hypothetical protein
MFAQIYRHIAGMQQSLDERKEMVNSLDRLTGYSRVQVGESTPVTSRTMQPTALDFSHDEPHRSHAEQVPQRSVLQRTPLTDLQHRPGSHVFEVVTDSPILAHARTYSAYNAGSAQ